MKSAEMREISQQEQLCEVSNLQKILSTLGRAGRAAPSATREWRVSARERRLLTGDRRALSLIGSVIHQYDCQAINLVRRPVWRGRRLGRRTHGEPTTTHHALPGVRSAQKDEQSQVRRRARSRRRAFTKRRLSGCGCGTACKVPTWVWTCAWTWAWHGCDMGITWA